jgi:hypothetical protein
MGAEMTTLLENYERGLRVHTTQCVVSYAAPQRRKRATIASPPDPDPRGSATRSRCSRRLFASVVQSVKRSECADPARRSD